jgi:hypothetical protein
LLCQSTFDFISGRDDAEVSWKNEARIQTYEGEASQATHCFFVGVIFTYRVRCVSKHSCRRDKKGFRVRKKKRRDGGFAAGMWWREDSRSTSTTMLRAAMSGEHTAFTSMCVRRLNVWKNWGAWASTPTCLTQLVVGAEYRRPICDASGAVWQLPAMVRESRATFIAGTTMCGRRSDDALNWKSTAANPVSCEWGPGGLCRVVLESAPSAVFWALMMTVDESWVRWKCKCREA